MKSKLSTISCILLLCLILAAHTLILLMMGRIPWCTCGHFQIWMGEAWSSHTSQHLLDPYSFSHVQHGILFFFVLYLCRVRPALGFWIACFTEVAWEILENSSIIIERYRSATASLDYFGDSIGNSLGDIACCLVGFAIAWRLPWKVTLGLYLLMEAGMLFFIRDCLSLNVLMLLHPVPAIKSWQMSGL